MPGRNGFPESPGQRRSAATTVVRPVPDSDEDVLVARRGAASFGGGDPTAREVLRGFVRRHGWRAYALPVLVVVTIAALLSARSGTPKPDHTAAAPPAGAGRSSSSSTPPPVADPNISLKQDDPSGGSETVLKVGQLPAGPDYTMSGDGTFAVLKGTTAKVGSGPLHTYDIEVENGVSGVDTKQFADMVDKTLDDPRSWSGHGISLQRVDSGSVDFHISLTSAMTVRTYCGYSIHVETSCYAAAYSVSGLDVNRVFLNVARWERGAAPYVGDLDAYRTYMINHEDGHALGHDHAHSCLADGLAPAMMQQTFGLTSATTHKLCEANPWPYPPGVTDAPGQEEPDTSANDEYNLGNRD